MKQTRCPGLIAALASLLIVGSSPLSAVARGDADLPGGCDGQAPPSAPLDSPRATWEYSPPTGGGTGHLVCARGTLASLLDASPGDWGVAVRDLRTRETLLVNPDRHFVAGSLYKLGVAAEVYARMDDGSLTEDSVVVVSEQDADPEYGGSGYSAGTSLSVRQAVHSMLTQSDNGAALALVDRLGLNAVNRRFALLGMPDTRLVYDAMTTPRDVLGYFTLLADGGVVSLDASDSLVQVLSAQAINDRIPAGLPADGGWRVAHKTANIDTMLGDAGIVFTAHNDAYALIVLNEGLTSYWSSVQTIRSISDVVYHVIVADDDQPEQPPLPRHQ